VVTYGRVGLEGNDPRDINLVSCPLGSYSVKQAHLLPKSQMQSVFRPPFFSATRLRSNSIILTCFSFPQVELHLWRLSMLTGCANLAAITDEAPVEAAPRVARQKSLEEKQFSKWGEQAEGNNPNNPNNAEGKAS
jgi:hypothetical protein